MSKANRRYIRTIILAVAAMSSLIWAAIDLFGIDPQVMLDLFLATAIGAAGIIVAAGIVVALVVGLKKLARLRQGDRD
jgi:ABC-type transport system involved in cytochrome c biogenesis permease component